MLSRGHNLKRLSPRPVGGAVIHLRKAPLETLLSTTTRHAAAVAEKSSFHRQDADGDGAYLFISLAR